MTDTKHTPTPWPSEMVEQIWLAGINKLFADGMFGISAVNAIMDKVVNADANHIVKCVNMHEELVEALKETRIDLVVLSGNIADAEKSNNKWEGMYDRVRAWIDRCDETLKKAGAL